MKKEKEYNAWFSAEAISQAASAFDALTGRQQKGKLAVTYRVTSGGESWTYDTAEDFYEAYGPDVEDAKFTKKIGGYSLYISYSRELNATKVAVGSSSRQEIEDIFGIFEAQAD
jgi:hypothetical protein